ncbi:unnamed protein product [Dicrocoelium dendriticum]|nr:unnamed protein product [Dicrocoelium dendriticum]
MTKDLLEELRQHNAIPEQQQYDGSQVQPPVADDLMEQFFTEIAWIREEVEKIEGYVSQLRVNYSEVLSAPQQNENTKRRIEQLTNQVKAASGQVLLKLKQQEQAIHELESVDPSLATVRIRRTQHSAITARFVDVMSLYSKIQIAYRDSCKSRIKVKLEIAECPRTDEEIEQMLESDNPQIFTQGILMDTQQARQNAADIEARHEDILKLEKSISELHELFQDLATLVSTQGDLIDTIQHNVNATRDHVEVAKQATHKAVEYKTKSRKKLIIICSVVGVILLIVILSLIGTLVPR